MKTLELELHPYCTFLPEMPESEFRLLVESIREHGLRQPIRIDEENRIVDGRHRYRACMELGYEPSIEVLHLEGEALIDWIIDSNVARRHLTSSQRAVVDQRFVAELRKIRESEGRERSKSNIVREVAQRTGTPERSIKRADRVANADPDLANDVKDGKISLGSAEETIKNREKNAAAKGPVGPLAKTDPKNAPEEIKDSEGNTVPPRLVGVFASGAKKYSSLRKAILDACEDLENASDLDCAITARNIADLTSQLKLGVPALVCQKCHGAGLIQTKVAGVTDGCTWCAGRGWLPEHVRLSQKRGAKR